VKEIKSSKNNRQFKCFKCNAFINVPTGFIGNPYILLEVHYVLEHRIDLKMIDWKKSKTILDDDISYAKPKTLDIEKNSVSEL